MEKEKNNVKEEIILAQIVKRDGAISMKHSKSANQFETYGFLRIYLELLEEQLYSDFETSDDFELF